MTAPQTHTVTKKAGMDVFKLGDGIVGDYDHYVRGFLKIRDEKDF